VKICAYVQTQYSKQAYSNECLDRRQFVGLRVVIDSLERAGFGPVEYAGAATVADYDLVLVSITSDCDWWQFIKERMSWRPGKYKVVCGGAGVLNVRPFLEFSDFFVLGRGENVVIELMRYLQDGGVLPESIIESSSFSADNKYKIAQVAKQYPHEIALSAQRKYCEGFIGCNHKCFFCGYTWHRQYVGDGEYKMSDSLFGGIEYKERAILDMKKDYSKIDFSRLRTTAIDGFSERLRLMCNKKISKQDVIDLLIALTGSPAKPHQLKIFNLVGLPSETPEDWKEFVDCVVAADLATRKNEKQWSIVLHSTPFRATPATPAAVWPMAKQNYRGKIGEKLGPSLKGNIFYQGKNFWCVESMGTDSLSSVILSAIAIRGTESDAGSIKKIAASAKFDKLCSADKEATLKHYFDIDKLFGAFAWDMLPTRYLTSYAQFDKACK
jgi:radical SAM superfamily enzyme YgiQ (UPF0313 family)